MSVACPPCRTRHRLPNPPRPVASLCPCGRAGGLAHVSGQLPFIDGELVTGRLGEDVELEHGARAAQACALMILAQLEAAMARSTGSSGCVKLGAFVNSSGRLHRSAQSRQRRVGTDGRACSARPGNHARSAVGVPALPLGAAVEVDAIVALAPH